MKILKRVIIALGIFFIINIILFAVGFLVVKHLKIKDIVENQIEQSMGIKVSIKEISFSPLLAHIALKGVTIHNPPGFQENELAYVEYIHFLLDPLEMIIRKNPNVYVLALNLQRLNIIKTKDGRINIKELIPIKNDTGKDPNNFFCFDAVVLSVGELNYIDYSVSSPKKRKYIIGIKNEFLLGLKNEDVVVKMIIYKAMENTDIGKMINLTIVPVVSQLHDTMVSSWGTVKVGTRGVWEISTLPWKLIFGSGD